MEDEDIKNKYEYLLYQIVLPRALPQNRSKDLEKLELLLLSRMADTIKHCSDCIPSATARLFKTLNQTHMNCTAENISKEIKALQPGDTFAMFVRHQNCGFMIYMPSDGNNLKSDDQKKVIVSTFPGSLPLKEIYKNQSDINFTYPVQALEMKFSKMMCSTDFAYQLCLLYDTLPMERENRDYVHNWLMTILSDEDTIAAEFPTITKKVRDEVLGKGDTQKSGLSPNDSLHKLDFFRRSSFYMSIKVFLQLSLTMELGHTNGKIIYKITMLQFMIRISAYFEDAFFPSVNVDLVTDLMAKMARRIEKLSEMVYEGLNHRFMTAHRAVIRLAKGSISKLRTIIDKQVCDLQRNIDHHSRLKPLADLDVLGDIYQNVPKLRDYIKKRSLSNDKPNVFNDSIQITPFIRHRYEQTTPPPTEKLSALDKEIDRNLFFLDVENWILYALDFEENAFDCELLRKWSYDYTIAAKSFYTMDQLGFSRMLLVQLKLVAMMDRMASEAHPLLLDHRSGIDSEVFDILLLPQLIDLQICYQLQFYFSGRNENASDPSLIEEREVSSHSFSVKFANESDELQLIRLDILARDELKVKEKCREHERGRDIVRQLRNELAKYVMCECRTYINSSGVVVREHCRNCQFCALRKRIIGMRILNYELSLPLCLIQQNAIVFELRIPNEIATLRDVLYLTTKPFSKRYVDEADIIYDWGSNRQISHHSNLKQRIVNFGSTSWYNRSKRFYSQEFHHVDKSFESLIIHNGYNCVFYASDNGAKLEICQPVSVELIKQQCCLHTELRSPYDRLQWTLNTTKHTQNEVLARQSECPQDLPLSIYKDFGSLRADGHRIQLRKLYAMIETEALPFNEPSVLSLVLQTIWETGVIGEGGFVRESHTDFNDPIFASVMIDLMDKFIDHQKDDWSHPIKLLTITFIAVRLFELNFDEQIADKLVVLLNKLRAVITQWIDKIENVLHSMKNQTQTDEKSLRLLLVFASLTGALTFFVNSHHQFFNKIFTSNHLNGLSAPQIWLQALVTLNNNILLSEELMTKSETKSEIKSHQNFDSNLRMFIRLVRNTGIHVESKIREMIKKTPNDMFELIQKQWALVKNKNIKQIYFHPTSTQTLVVHVEIKRVKKNITIDIITGSFLVNNIPVARLPKVITNSSMYQRIFGEHIFEVQPDTSNSFSTVHKYNGCSYEFGWSGHTLNISEHRMDGVEMELLPFEILTEEIPTLLVENYSHWWHPFENIIEFRPKMFSDKNFSNTPGIAYKLDLKSGRLIHVITGRCLLDIKSGSYLKIRDHLKRLEEDKYILMLMDKPNVAEVELVRMHLKFKVDCSKRKRNEEYDMLSNEYSQMRVSLKQNCGTLYGLDHGLLLENVDSSSSSKLLILPHSKINTTCTNSHVKVTIDLNLPLLNPPFHRYEVDKRLRQLKASNSNLSAWLYLAYLHAVTSHGEKELFIGMSGIERALQILQSSFLWSSVPYNDEALRILERIACLSPERDLCDEMQRVLWPKDILKTSALDSFIFIANKLVADSQRLSGLYFQTPVPVKSMKIRSLHIRDYMRCLQLKPNLKIQDAFISDILSTVLAVPITYSIIYSPNTRCISSLYHRKSHIIPDSLDLKKFLMDADRLDGPIHMEDVSNILNHNVTLGFANLWISLYEVARKKRLNPEHLALIYTLFSHEKKEYEPILALQSVANNSDDFKDIKAPRTSQYIISEGTFSTEKVSEIIKGFYKKPYDYDSEEWSNSDREKHDQVIALEINLYVAKVKLNWPCDTFDYDLLYTYTTEYISIEGANSKLNQMLPIWNDNRRLSVFIDAVESRMRDLATALSIKKLVDLNINIQQNTNISPRYDLGLEAKMCKNLNSFKTILYDAEQVWQENKGKSEYSAKQWWSFYRTVVNSHENIHLIDAGLYPRLVPSLVLPRIASQRTHPQMKSIIGALALAIVHEQRMARINQYTNQPERKTAMTKEIENEPHVNWKPMEYPEWLLFEIEQNVTIRRLQIEVAKRMIAPPEIETRHSVMQLNMGEGKTAVIVPILAAFLADGKQVCQITVLKSLFATNSNLLRQCLGGMLNRRLYTVPCRRDLPVGDCVDKILDIYEEGKEIKGVFLTLPEHRLSFQLKIYESVQSGDIKKAEQFLSVHKWINSNIRNILDESDAILQAKYQMIYTVGNQLPLDGDVKRWTVTQAILKRIPQHMKRLYTELGADKIEFGRHIAYNCGPNEAAIVDRNDVFIPTRILDESVYTDLRVLLIEDFIEGRLDIAFPEITTSLRKDLKEFLTKKQISTEIFNRVLHDFSTPERNILMILSGLLRFEVLKLVLTKRWRVNYGVNEKGRRKMAIPYKAKDVAAETTEFGHPDVAICLTQLSYYYSGLTNDQLIRVFQHLETIENSAEIYEKWISSIPDTLVGSSIQTYAGVNLIDPNQRDQVLFPLLRFNVFVIDHWLSIEVYPREAKTFEKKLMCTAWDLCTDHMKHLVTGFSGTNDTKNILPLPIAQNDLEELEQTNENVRQILLQEENEGYKNLPANISGKKILELLVVENIPVLLDAGALILEMNNEETAREWLKLASTVFDAAVYFDTQDILQTIDRNGIKTEFDCSVYRENLKRCLVYLDDVHTRGTDLAFPLGWRACVTLCGDIARDKTVQACSRMRQLGQGHMIAFWASHEADIRIRETCNLLPNDCLGNKHVIEFICNNSKRFETENTVHWAAAAYNYTKKIAGHKLHENYTDEQSMINLYEKCVDDEFVTLESMYGEKEEALLTEITKLKFNKLTEVYRDEVNVSPFIQNINDKVITKLTMQANDVKRFKHALDEEQEKELEQEKEQERQIERPQRMAAAIPHFDMKFEELFMTGSLNVLLELITNRKILSFSSSLLNTQMYKLYKDESCPWSENLFITQDHIHVLDNASHAFDEFLRPVWWIGGIATNIWIILSSYECDRLMPTFRKSTMSALFMYRPRLSKLHSNLLHEHRLIVTGMAKPLKIDLKSEIQISVYSGSMYFKNEIEQNAYCGFLGLIPRPRPQELELAFKNGIIKPNGFVTLPFRKYSELISKYVGQCSFISNPVELVSRLIIAHHQFIRKESHVASIFTRGFKLQINDISDHASDT